MANVSESWMHDINNTDYHLDTSEEPRYHPTTIAYVFGSLLIIAIIVSILTNILGFASLVYFRMWLKHEGYFYLAALFASNIGILIFHSVSFCIMHWNFRYYPPNTSEFMCKVWHFLMTIYFAVGWLSVALLMDVYLREHLVHRRRCGCPLFAAKYCTLFASKIIVGIIFGLVLILGLPYMGLLSLEESKFGPICGPYVNFVAFYVLLLVKVGLMWALPCLLFTPIILLLILCTSRGQSEFSQVSQRSIPDGQFRTLAITISAIALLLHIIVVVVSALGVPFLFIINAASQTVLAFWIGFQPILCFIIVAEFRSEVLGKLKDLGCCSRLLANRSPSSEVQTVRMQDIEENPE